MVKIDIERACERAGWERDDDDDGVLWSKSWQGGGGEMMMVYWGPSHGA